MTLAQFSDIFALLAVQLRATDADEITIRAYYATLKDLDPEFLAMAAQRMALVAEWFPKTSEWRAMAIKIETERTDEIKARMRKLPTPLCLDCDDTSWRREGVRFRPCACRKLRRLEVLGRRPMPALPDATPIIDEPSAMERVRMLIRGAVKSL